MERTRDEQIAIANEIIRQLGGRKFTVMTGARDYFATDEGLRFRLPGGGGFTRQGINLVHVDLLPSDTYRMRFSRVRKARGSYICNQVAEYNNVFNDQLQGIFTAETGLDTHL